ncbi:hypothetical protein GCM10009624_13680 [Gordonia sinesedis]
MFGDAVHPDNLASVTDASAGWRVDADTIGDLQIRCSAGISYDGS